MDSLSAKLEEMGVGIQEFDEAIRVYVDKPKVLNGATLKPSHIRDFLQIYSPRC